MDEFREVLNLNATTNKETDLKTYWNYRFALDKRLETLVKTVESVWIGPFIGLFMGKCNDPYFYTVAEKLRKFCIDSMVESEIEQESTIGVTLKVLCESFPLLDKDKFVNSMICLFGKCDSRFQLWFEKGESLFSTYYKQRNIDPQDFSTRIKFGPVSLIVSSPLQQFPFETMPSLQRIKQDIFRMPSLRCLIWMYQNHRKYTRNLVHGFSDDNAFYLIDPNRNLPNTSKFFRPKIDRMVDKHNWTGFMEEEPNEAQFPKQLEKHDLYIYFGHNSGNEYYKYLERSTLNCLAVVVGCSSGKVFAHSGPLDITGTAYKFLLNGCPSYVGCLWEVTDRDIDRFADQFMNHISHNWDEQNEHAKVKNVCQAINLSRNKCKLLYLNGAATVIYGLPVFFEKYVKERKKSVVA
jgi:separase